MVPSEDTWHKCVLKLINFFVQNLQKPYMIDLVTYCPLRPDHGTPRGHVARGTCPQMCLEVSQLFCPKSPKTLHV